VIPGRPIENTTSRCPLLDDFLTKLNTLKNISYDEREKLSKGCIEALKNVVKPAYDEMMKYTKDLEAKATNDDGAWKWPEGRKFYSMALSSTTTTDLKPEEIFLW
jgi:uncharacterized protein (DUF885 family)